MKKYVIAFLFLPLVVTKAAIESTVIVEGKITNFDKKSVELYKDGKIISVPRTSIPKYFKVKPGQNVYAVVPLGEKGKDAKSGSPSKKK